MVTAELAQDFGNWRSTGGHSVFIARACFDFLAKQAAACVEACDLLEDSLSTPNPAGLVAATLRFAEKAESLRTALQDLGLDSAARSLKSEQRTLLQTTAATAAPDENKLGAAIESYRMSVQALLDDLQPQRAVAEQRP